VPAVWRHHKGVDLFRTACGSLHRSGCGNSIREEALPGFDCQSRFAITQSPTKGLLANCGLRICAWIFCATASQALAALRPPQLVMCLDDVALNPPVQFLAELPGRQAAWRAQCTAGGRPGNIQVAAADVCAQAGAAGHLHIRPRLLRRGSDGLRHPGATSPPLLLAAAPQSPVGSLSGCLGPCFGLRLNRAAAHFVAHVRSDSMRCSSRQVGAA